ncbi:MAG: sigma-70 family RNA polymerase sigma factor, partial [Muribaculaceae bacterium]|nr:sigma-70 family RNA polymerase sigma factor [Muribaculaceae bacterium]
LLKNDEDAKDALQDAFFNLWKSGGAESTAEARNKLFKVLRNICIDRLRKPGSLSLENIARDIPGTSPHEYEDMERYEALLTRGLSDMQMQIYSLITHKGIEYDEVANRLNQSVEAVRMNMSRARKKIRENYRQLENERSR